MVSEAKWPTTGWIAHCAKLRPEALAVVAGGVLDLVAKGVLAHAALALRISKQFLRHPVIGARTFKGCSMTDFELWGPGHLGAGC